MTQPWIWLASGLALGILELIVPGWVFLGFALGAIAVGLVLAAGPPEFFVSGSVAWLFILYAVLSLAAWAALHFALGSRRGQVRIWKRDINDDGPPTSS